MHDNIFNAVSRSFKQPLVQRDDTFSDQTGTPARIHFANANNRHRNIILLKHRIDFLDNSAKNIPALLIQEITNHALPFRAIRQILQL